MNKRTHIPLKGGWEHDALTGWRRFMSWHAGERKAIKRGYNRRLRRQARRELRAEATK